MSRRPSSPSSTSFSGASNYRSDNFRPLRDRVDPTPKIPEILDSRQVARRHYEELQQFLASHLAKEPLNSRSSAREKLTRLTKQQFQELSTDVYDELIRRNNNSEQNEVPFLPVRDDFHPKRNQARQKLATLPKTRFKDLSSDVFYELGRRYPEFKEPETMQDRDSNGYGDSHEPRRPSHDALRDAEAAGYNRKPSGDTVGSGRQGSNESADGNSYGDPRRNPSGDRISPYPNGGSGSDRRRPSEDTIRSYQGQGSKDGSMMNNLSGFRKASQDSINPYGGSVGPATATSGMIIPNKSTIAEEEINVPYGNDDEDTRDMDGSESGDTSPAKAPQLEPIRSNSQGFGGLGNTLINTPISPTEDGRGQSEYYDQLSLGRASVASSVLNGSRATRENREAAEQMRSEYEFKIATMQNKIATLEADLATVRGQAGDNERNRAISKEHSELQIRVEDQAAVIRSLQREIEDARSVRENESRQKEAQAKRHTEYQDHIRSLQGRIEDMEANGSRRQDPEMADELRAEMQNLVDELKELSMRNDELLSEKDADQSTIFNLQDQVKEYKRKYEQAKSELRGFKATSQLFHVQTPKMDESLPISETGGILDIHVHTFQTAVDNLLSVARGNSAAGVITPMRYVVKAVTFITDDLRSFEQRSTRQRGGLEEESVKALRERVDATLSNLTAAVKNHATSHGLSPVSLVDAAASHVSAAVIASVTAVQMRRATAAERDQDRQQQAMGDSYSGLALSTSSSPSGSRSGLPTASLRNVDSLRNADRHGRTTSETSQWSNSGSRPDGYGVGSPLGKGRSGNDVPRRGATMSDRSSNPSPQPPPIFDTPVAGANGTSDEDTGGDAWETELKPYLDAQAESIVIPIRILLSSIRAGASAAELNDNLTQIIAIVQSVVSVCKGHLPPASAKVGEEILAQLSDNCNKLSELQAQEEMTKQTRQVMAASSFAVAKAIKELRGLK